MSELNRHKKSDKVKWVITGISFVLVFALLIGLFLQIFGKGKMKPSEWFNNQTEEVQPEGEGGMVVNEGQGTNGIKLTSTAIQKAQYEEYGISSLAETAQVVTATINPAEATDTELIWSIAWDQTAENEGGSLFWTEQEWYSDGDSDYSASNLASIGVTENDFIQISPSSDTLSCTVSCSQAFGCPITLTVTSVDNPEATDTCRIDYRNKITSVNITAADISLKDSATNSSWRYSVYSSAGTITPDISVDVKIIGQLDWPEFFDDVGLNYSEYELRYGSWASMYGNYFDENGQDDSATVKNYSTYSQTFCTINTEFEDFVNKFIVGGLSNYTANQQKVALEQVRTLLLNETVSTALETQPLFQISVDVTNLDTDEKFSQTQNVYLTDVSQVSSFRVPVTNVNMNKDNIIF